MRLPYAKRPGGGFLTLTGVLVASAVFFTWGAREPLLDRVWQLAIELEIGERDRLTPRELVLLQEVFWRHPDLAESLLDGAPAALLSTNDGGLVHGRYVYIVRRAPEPPLRLSVTPAGTTDEPISTRVTLGALKLKGRAETDAPLLLELPAQGRFPQLIEVVLEQPDKERQRPPARVRLEVLP